MKFTSQTGDVCVVLTVAEKRYFLPWCFGGRVFLGDRTVEQEVAMEYLWNSTLLADFFTQHYTKC